MPIKVLVISDYSDYHSTRPEGAIFIGLAKLGYEVHIMTYKGRGYAVELEKAGLTVVDFHPQKKFSKTEISTIRTYINEKGIQILHLFNSKATINGIRAARGLKVKVVLYRGFSGHIHWYDPTAYVKYLHPRVDAIMCNSIGVEKMFRSQLFFRKHKAVTINKGHQLGWYDGVEPLDIRTEFNIPSDAFLLVNVCNNRRMKGIPYLLQAMKPVLQQTDVHLLLVGRDLDTPENQQLVKDTPKPENIHFMGFRKDALSIVAACDVFVLPSIYGESITKSVIEAMSLGVTPAISDIRGNVELVEDSVNGLVFTSKDVQQIAETLLKLEGDRDFCKKAGEASREHVQNHLNSETTVQKVAELYTNLLKESE